MACRVTYKKGKVFFKDDFINMMLDTMRLSDAEIKASKYLSDKGYKNVFEIGKNDPLGLLKKSESKSPDIPGTPITEDVPMQPIKEPDVKPNVEGNVDGDVVGSSVAESMNNIRPKTNGHNGSSGETKFTSELTKPFTYKIIESEELHPSHLPSGERNPSHQIANAQPKERNDMGSKHAQDKIAENPNLGEVSESPNAYFGAPIVNEHGEVIQGNNRSIGLKKHYDKGGIKYKSDLAANAEKFGLTKDQVEGMKSPVLVRELKVSDNEAISLGQHDVKDIETGGKQHIDPIATSRKIKPQDKSKLTSILFGQDYVSVKEAVRQNASKVGQVLRNYLNTAQMKNTFNAEGEFTAKGMDDVSALVTHFLFEDGSSVLPEVFDGLPDNIKKGLQKSLPNILSLGKEKSLIDETQNAMLALHEFRASNSGSFDDWANAFDIFKNATPKDIFTETEMRIAKELDKAKNQSDIKKIFQKHEELISGTPANLMDEAIPGISKKDAIKKQFNIDYNENRKNNKPQGYPQQKGENGSNGAVPEKSKPTATPPGEEGGIKSTPNGKEETKGRKEGLLSDTPAESQGAVTPLSETKGGVGGDNSVLVSVESTSNALKNAIEKNNEISDNLEDLYLRENGKYKMFFTKIGDDLFYKLKGLTGKETKVELEKKGIIINEYNKDRNKFLADNESRILAEAYHKAKIDGTNPELVKAVEQLLKEQSTKDIPLSEPKADTSLKPDPSPPKSSLELAKDKLKAAKERAAKLRDNTNLGTTIDPFEKTKQQAIADREVLDGYIGVAKEYIKEGIKTVEEFAKAIGEKIEDVKKAWDFAEKGEVYGIKVDMLDDAVKDALHDKGDRRKFDEVETEARRKVAVGEIRPEEMINKINSGEKYLPNGEDIIALIDHKVNLEKQRTEIKKRFDEAQDQGVKNKIQGELDIVTDKLFQWDEMAIRTAADQSQAFRFRQLMRDNEFNAVKAIRDWKAEDKNGTIPAEMEAKIKEWAEKFRVLNEELAKKDQELILEKEGRAEDNMKAEAEREKLKEALDAKKNPEKSKSTLSPEKLARKKELWKDIYGQANDVLHVIAKMATKDGIEFLSLVFEEAAGDFKKFSKEIIAGAGKEIAPYLKKLYKDAGGTDEGIYGASKPFLNKKGDLEVPHSLIRALVESGVEKIEDITKAVHAMVKDEFPGITETKVRDTITKYGLTRNPNPDVIERKISLAKRIGRKLSSVERLKKLKAPLKSGLIPVDITPIERQLNREIRNMQKLLPKTQEEITKVWKTAVERTKTRLQHQIEDLDIAINTSTKMVKADGKATPDTKEINDLRDRKAALQKVYDEKFGKNAHELTDAERVERAINALEKESKNIAKDIKNGETAYKNKKSLPVNEALKKARERNKLIKEVLADLRKEEGLASAKEMEMRKDANVRYVLKQRERIKNKEFDPKPKKAFAKDDELLNILVQRRKVKQEWETAREKHRMEQRTLAEQWYETWRDIWGGTKSAITSLDVSAGGRQGLPLSIANPAMAKKAMKLQFEHMFSQEASDRWLADLQNKPIYQLMKDAKLYISEPTSKLLAKEESFASNFAEKIPWVKPSERAYVGYLNSIRTDVFEKMVGVLEDQGKTWEKNPQAFKDAAKFINDLTGRGPINENAAKVLSDPIIGMFSPRYVASRFSFFNPKNYLDPKIDPVVRQERIKTAVKFMGTVASVLALMKYSGMADVSLDPTSTDFLKIKIGNKRIDILAGYSQVFGFMAKMVAEAYKQIKYLQTGVKPEGGTNEEGLLEISGHFYRGKGTPVGSAAVDLYMGEDIIGNKSTIAGEAAGLVTPLVSRDIYDLYKKEGAGWAAGLAIPLLFGIPTTSYGVTDKIWEVSAMSPEGNKINVLGEEINPKAYESNKGKEITDVWKFLDKYSQRPLFPKKSDLNLKDENGKNRAPSNEEAYNYILKSGEFIKEELRDLMDNGRKDDNSEYTDEETGEIKYTYTDMSLLTPEEQKKEISKAIGRAKERAKKELFEDD